MSFTCRKYIAIFFSFLLFTACDSVSFISLNVKVPARIAFPDNIKDVVIVNNAGFQPPTEGNTLVTAGGTDTFSLPVDSLSMYVCRSIQTNIDGEHFFSGVDFYNIQLREGGYIPVKPIPAEKVNEIAELTQADALISLDFFQIKNTLSVKAFSATYDVTTQLLLGIYMPGENRKGISLKDTIFWESYGINTTEALNGLPYLDEATLVAAERAGEIAMRALIPHTQVEDRKYYTSSSGPMKKADRSIKENDWSTALNIWTNMYNETASLSKRAKCAVNIALAYEIMDDFTQAEEWAVQARKEFSASGSNADLKEVLDLEYYIDRLKHRKAESKLLDDQE